MTTVSLNPFIPIIYTTVEIVTQERVKGWYPRDTPPFSHAKAYGPELYVFEAARNVLAWLWSQHHQATGAACPFAFETILA